MTDVQIRDMTDADAYYVTTCSHVHESPECDASGQRRRVWLGANYAFGVRAKVALLDGQHAGFAYVMPIEVCPWGPLGRDLAVMPCLYVPQSSAGHGLGQALVAAAEDEAQTLARKALVIPAYYSDFWFMPAAYFERLGYMAAARKGRYALLWKTFVASAEPPRMLAPAYRYRPVPSKVVVDLFWHTFCQTSDVEAQRVRQVVAEFGDDVILNDYCADDRETLLQYQIPRAIYVNGEQISWGYEAPPDGIREAIAKALDRL